jgi:hypothetical protein
VSCVFGDQQDLGADYVAVYSLSRAHNEGQLPVINAWISLGCIALLLVFISSESPAAVPSPTSLTHTLDALRPS